jgi:hypothetical protein
LNESKDSHIFDNKNGNLGSVSLNHSISGTEREEPGKVGVGGGSDDWGLDAGFYSKGEEGRSVFMPTKLGRIRNWTNA